MLANPSSTFLNPSFIFVLLFGTVVGMKLTIVFYIIVGMIGMWLVAQDFGIRKWSSFLPPIVFMLGSTYALRVQAGHSVWLPIALVPFVFLFFRKSLQNWKFVILSSLFNSFIFFGGAVYPLLFCNLFIGIYAIIDLIVEKRTAAMKMLFVFIILTVLFSSVKLIPFINFSSENTIVQDDVQKTGLGILFDSFLNRDQSLTSRVYESNFGIVWAWHEYGHYIGFLVLLLSLSTVFLLWKKKEVKKLFFTIIIFLFIALGSATPINLWDLLHKLPLLSTLHGSFRALFIVTFCVAILAAFALSKVERIKKIWGISGKTFVMIVVILVLFDYYLVVTPIYNQAFPEDPMIDAEETSFVQVYSTDSTKYQFRNMLQNWGTANCYERVSLQMGVTPMFRDDKVVLYDNYIGEAYLLNKQEAQEIMYFSPNKIIVDVKTNNPDSLVLNQNYYNGWKANGKDVLNKEHLIATDVSESGEVTFRFMPTDFIVGLIISIISIIAAIIIYLKK